MCRSEFSEVLHAESPGDTPVPISSVISRRDFSMNGAFSISYRSRLERSEHVHASRIRRLTCGMLSAFASISPPRYRNSLVCTFLWPAASTMRGDVGSTWLSVRSSIVSVFVWDTVNPIASKTATVLIIIYSQGFPPT